MLSRRGRKQGVLTGKTWGEEGHNIQIDWTMIMRNSQEFLVTYIALEGSLQ